MKDLSRKLPGADTPVVYACEIGADRALGALIDGGAPVVGKESFKGFHPFVIAQEKEKIAVMRTLLERKQVPDEVLEHAFCEAVRYGRVEALRFILETAKVKVLPRHFRQGSYKKDPEIIRILVAAGGNLNEADADGETPFHAIVHMLNLPLVRTMAELGANVNAVDFNGRTPLMKLAHSLERTNPSDADAAIVTIEVLTQLGADASVVDRDGNDAIDHYLFEIMRGDRRPVEEILGTSGQMILQAFKKAGAKGSGPTFELFLGLRDDDIEKIKAAIRAGADVNRIPPPESNFTPLMWTENIEILDLLLDSGADPNKPAAGFTPLIRAAEKGNIELVERLLAGGADLHATEPRTAGNETVPDNALTAAENSGKKEMVAHLKSLGATKPVLKWEPFKPGVESWNDFSERLVKSDPATAVAGIAKIIGGRIQADVYRKEVEIGTIAYLAIRPKGMQWCNIFRLAPRRTRYEPDQSERIFAVALSAELKADVLMIDYSDTSDAATVERFSPAGGVGRDDGWDYRSLQDIIGAIGAKAAPNWMKERLKQTSRDGSSSSDRVKKLAATEKFVAAAFSFGFEEGPKIEIDVHGYPAEAFDPVYVVTV